MSIFIIVHNNVASPLELFLWQDVLKINCYINELIKMAESENQCVENAFNILIGITEKSGNLRKDYKRDIRKSVSTLRKAFNELKSSLDSKADENKKL